MQVKKNMMQDYESKKIKHRPNTPYRIQSAVDKCCRRIQLSAKTELVLTALTENCG